MVITSWSHLFDLIHGGYVLGIAPIFAIAFFGGGLYLVANKRRESWAAGIIRGIGASKHRALRDHPAICSACGYPTSEGDNCPECGADYSKPGAVMLRGEFESRRLPIPRWLSLAAIAFVLTFAAWLLAPAALLVGNKIEWGAFRVKEEGFWPEYTPVSNAGAPQYKVLLSATFIVPTDREDNRGPLAGTVTFILEDPITSDLGWLNIQAIDQTWELHYHRGGINAKSLQPTSVTTGQGMDVGIDEMYKVTGFDRYWSGSQAELADMQRLGAISIGPNFRTIEDPSSLDATSGALVWTPNTVQSHSSHSLKVRHPMPVSQIAGMLGLVVLSIPIVAAFGYAVIRFVRR